MAILYDARGNPITVSFPDAVTNETITDARPITALLAATNAEVVIDLNGAAVATFDCRTAALSGNFVFEGTLDGVNYFGLPAFALIQVVTAGTTQEVFVVNPTTTTVVTGVYVVRVSGLRRVRLRMVLVTTGNLTVAVRASAADFAAYSRAIPSTLHITATAAANAIATATLPAAGVGLFHYITSIQCARNATALVAGTATLIITSTNLPGTPAWSVGNAMAAGGTQPDVSYEPANPLKSLVANTATTVVMPAGGAAVLNRINVSYYVGA